MKKKSTFKEMIFDISPLQHVLKRNTLYWLCSWLYLCLLSQPNEPLGWFFTSSGRTNTNFIMCQISFILKGTGVKLRYFYLFQYLIKCPFISFVVLFILIMAMLLKYMTEFIHSFIFLTSYFKFFPRLLIIKVYIFLVPLWMNCQWDWKLYSWDKSYFQRY